MTRRRAQPRVLDRPGTRRARPDQHRRSAAPLVLTGLAVGVGFKAGLFNIGGTGQVLVGAFVAALVGAAVAEQPVPIAVTVALVAGALGGAFYGFIPGALKAFTGAHEVVSTIMLNSLALPHRAAWSTTSSRSPARPSRGTADVGNAALPVLFGPERHTSAS